MKTPDIVYIRWLAWSVTWLVGLCVVGASVRDALLIISGVLIYALGRFVDYVIVEVGR